MAYCPYPVMRPPPRQPPPHLLEDYTMKGLCPITRYMYFDESYSAKSGNVTVYNATKFKKLLALDHMKNINIYRDNYVMKNVLKKLAHIVKQKHIAVVGTKIPWAEAMLINLGARHVTTIEYADLVIEDNRVTTITPYKLAKKFCSGQAAPFDTVFTYSSLEHSGLGRYGDPLSPFGDLEATAQVWCMIKPNGHFILAVPRHKDITRCSLIWNAGRIYGVPRLQHLTANWRVINAFNKFSKRQSHGIYVLQKAAISTKVQTFRH